MTSATQDADKVVDEYLRVLGRALQGLPKGRRHDIVSEIRGHLRLSLSELTDPGGDDVRAVIARMGEPADIAAEAMAGEPLRASRPWWVDAGVLLLLPVCETMRVSPRFYKAAVVGWFAGLALLWTSRRWTRIDKVVGTVLLPGFPVIVLLNWIHGPEGLPSFGIPKAYIPTAGIIAAISFLAVPVLSGAWLGFRLWRYASANDRGTSSSDRTAGISNVGVAP